MTVLFVMKLAVFSGRYEVCPSLPNVCNKKDEKNV